MSIKGRHNVMNYGGGKGVFDTGSERLGDSDIDLVGKLSILFKRGVGQRYVSKPNSLDAPTKDKHQQYLNTQFARATNDYYIKTMYVDMDRKKAFADFKAMDYTPEISSALDIYADECLTKNEYGDVITINCDNGRIKTVLENLYNDILDIDHNLWHWTRSTCKFGNHYVLLDVQENRGVVGTINIKQEEVIREEAFDGNISSVKFNWETQGIKFDNWQIAHFRLSEDQRHMPYGTASLESTRLIWKQLQLAEDAMLIYRVTRAPERRVFYIDVGNVKPDDVPQFMADIKNATKRTAKVNEQTGSIDFKYNSMAIDEDYYIPRRNDKSSEIDTLPGASNLDEIADIEYLQKKLFASLKIPKAYLTFDEDINAKATLASEDFRFARTINRIQQALITTLTQIGVIHLYSLGFREKEQLTEFNLELTNPSTQTEIEKMEIWEQKANVFSSMWDESTLSPVSYVWALKNIFNFDEAEIKNMLQQQFLEGKMKLEIEQVSYPEEPVGEPIDEPMGEPVQEGMVTKKVNSGMAAKVMKFNNLEEADVTFDKLIKLSRNKKTKKVRMRRNLVENTLSGENTLHMLSEMDGNGWKNSQMLEESE